MSNFTRVWSKEEMILSKVRESSWMAPRTVRELVGLRRAEIDRSINLVGKCIFR